MYIFLTLKFTVLKKYLSVNNSVIIKSHLKFYTYNVNHYAQLTSTVSPYTHNTVDDHMVFALVNLTTIHTQYM